MRNQIRLRTISLRYRISMWSSMVKIKGKWLFTIPKHFVPPRKESKIFAYTLRCGIQKPKKKKNDFQLLIHLPMCLCVFPSITLQTSIVSECFPSRNITIFLFVFYESYKLVLVAVSLPCMEYSDKQQLLQGRKTCQA